MDPNQLSLFEDPHLENHETKTEPTEEITYRRRKASGRKAELTKDLPVEEIHCELYGEDCQCESCGEKMKPIGKKIIREEVCFIPAKLYKKV
ncbi:MAG: IS66 family transposase, partial [Turicibacter sp.]|nr:IS66 family transposase [Turicibacter sp.]